MELSKQEKIGVRIHARGVAAALVNKKQRAIIEKLRAKFPDLVSAAERQMSKDAGLGAAESAGWFDSFIGSIKEVAPLYVASKQQQTALDAELARAKAAEAAAKAQAAREEQRVLASQGVQPGLVRYAPYVGIALVLAKAAKVF